MKKTEKGIKFTGALSKQEITWITSKEEIDKMHNSPFVRRKVAMANEALRKLKPEALERLRSSSL